MASATATFSGLRIEVPRTSGRATNSASEGIE